MSNRRFTIMVVPPSTGGVRQYSLPHWIGSAVIGAGAFIVFALIVSVGLAVWGISRSGNYSGQVAENTALRASLTDMESDVSTLRQRLADLEEMEQSVRMVFGFPVIDPAERALGIGGGEMPDADDANNAAGLTFELETEIDRLLRRCAFERENYGEVLNGLVDRKDQLDHTPSIYPTGGYFSRGFGMKVNPFTGKKRPHRGIDMAGYTGMPIYAPADGRVARRSSQKEMGRMLIIDHGFGVQTLYGHLSKYVVKLNTRVKRGELIAYMGNSGNSTGPHLHYEVRVNGRATNPMNYIYDKAPSEPESLAKN